MLKFFSRLEKTRNFILFLFVLVMVASLVLFFAPTRDTVQSNLAFSKDAAAKVGSEVVTIGELALRKENLEKQFGSSQFIKSDFLLNDKIREKIISIEAKRLGFGASDVEVAADIREQFKPQDGKPFEQARYEQIVTEGYGSVPAFEQTVRESIATRKLAAFITSSVSVSEEEVLNDFKRKNSKFDLNFVSVNTNEVAASIKPTDEELKAYFEQNKANYRINLPQKKIRYVFLNTAKIGEKLEIPEADLKADYDKLPEDRKQAGVNGQQIVVRIPKPDQETQTLAKAEEIAAQARKEGKISEEAFGELAKGRSEDPGSAATGGKLKGLVRPNPNNPTDPYQRLLAMQEGEVSEPIKFGTSFYILRRGASVPKSFEDAKKELEISARNRKAYEAASVLAQKVSDRLKEVKDVQKVAEEFAGQANSSAKDMVRETDYLKKDDDVPNIGVSPQFEEGIAMLENPNDVGDKIPVKDGFAVPLLVDKKEPRDAELAEVKDKVTEAYKLDQAGKRVEQLAKDIAAGASSASALAAAAQSKGLKAEDSKNFILGSPLGKGTSAATSEVLEEAIYALKSGEVTKAPIKAGDNWYIVGVTNRTEASMDEFAKQREQLVQGMLNAKRGQVFQDYLADVRRRMETAGQIVIYKDAVKQLDTASEVETPEGQTN